MHGRTPPAWEKAVYTFMVPASRAHRVFLAAVVVGSSACSLIVSTRGLSGGGDASTPNEDSGSGGSSSGSGLEAGGADTDALPADSSRPDADSGHASDSPPDAALDSLPDTQDSPTCTPITVGLVGHYPMGAGSISGSNVNDVSGSGHNGSLVGFTQAEPQSAPAPYNQALVFPAANQGYVQIANLPLDTAPGGHNSVSMWFYRTGPVGNVNDVLVSLPNSPVYDLWLTWGVTNAGAKVYLCINVGQSDCFGIASTNLLDRWVHVVAVFANGATTGGALYVDGQPQTAGCVTTNGFSSCSGLSATAGTPLDFGMGNSAFFYYGSLYDARIYNRALTATEARALHDGTACP
jgi:hypothetical protein